MKLLNIQILFSTPQEAIHIVEFIGEQTTVEEETIVVEEEES
jgi:hypothetical protein